MRKVQKKYFTLRKSHDNIINVDERKSQICKEKEE